MILTWGARRGTRDEAGPPESKSKKAKVEEGCREASPEIPHRAGRCRRRNYLRRFGDGWCGNTRAGSTPQRRAPTWKVCSHGTHVNSLHRCCTAANSRRSFATAANMSEEFILSIKFIDLIMVTHYSTLLGTLPPIPTNDSGSFDTSSLLQCFNSLTFDFCLEYS